jgi:hypothetical protein
VVTPLVELVAEVRQAAETRLFGQLAGPVTADQAQALESALQVSEGQRRSQLDLWRRGERSTTGGWGGGDDPAGWGGPGWAVAADAARLSAYQHKHINVHGHYSFALPDLGGARRPLRDPDAVEG